MMRAVGLVHTFSSFFSRILKCCACVFVYLCSWIGSFSSFFSLELACCACVCVFVSSWMMRAVGLVRPRDEDPGPLPHRGGGGFRRILR
jgi:hypothetical protein